MSMELNVKKDVTAEAIVQVAGIDLRIDSADVFMSKEDDKELIIQIQDKTNPENKIQIHFNKK